jgi:AraC-like DNA-binding protein
VQPFEPGDLALLGPEVPHTWMSRPTGDACAATVVQFAASLVVDSPLPELSRAAVLVARAARGLRIDGPARGLVFALLRRMRSSGDFRRLAALCEILGVLIEHSGSLSPIAESVTNAAAVAPVRPCRRRVDRILEWIHANLARDLTVEEASRLAQVTPAAFSRFFHREVGRTFSAYLNDVRCAEASLRLQQSDRPVRAIAHGCGYTTLSHFNRQFRIRMGVSPRRFRSR